MDHIFAIDTSKWWFITWLNKKCWFNKESFSIKIKVLSKMIGQRAFEIFILLVISA